MPGPSILLRWGIPDGTDDQATGLLGHDDERITSAPCYEFDQLESPSTAA